MPQRKVTFEKRTSGAFKMRELVGQHLEHTAIVNAEYAFRRMTELKNEGFREVPGVRHHYTYVKED